MELHPSIHIVMHSVLSLKSGVTLGGWMRQGTQRVFSDCSHALRLDAVKLLERSPIQETFEDLSR
jgi:hypothetical protein